MEHRGLAFKAENRAIDIRLAEQDTDIVHEIACLEVVCPVNDNVVVLTNLQGVVGAQHGLVRVDVDMRIDVAQTVFGRLQLRAANIFRAMQDLPLQVTFVHDVKIHNANAAHSSRCQVQRQRCTKSPSSNEQDAGGFEFTLPLHTDLG
jgi:hypothetical protein